MFLSWRHWPLGRLRSSSRASSQNRRRLGHSALGLEILEDRTLLSFAGPAVFNLPGAPQGVATGFFEGNHAPLDIATADANGTLSILLGRGDGTFGNPINLQIGGSLTSVATGDLIGNGLQDIVTANSNGTISVVMSKGNGAFQNPQSFTIGRTPTGVALGDFLHNGILDIVTANSDGTVSLLVGNGKGGFASPKTSKAGGRLSSVAVGDFNGDGKLDVVVGTDSSVEVLTGNGDGTFTLKSTVPFNFLYANLVIPIAVQSVAVGDLRHDGKPDIVALADGGVNVVLGNGDGTFQNRAQVNSGAASAGALALGDFTGDGKLDIATSNFARQNFGAPTLDVLAGIGNGTFAAPVEVEVGETGSALAAGDFRGNGKLDLALASHNGANNVAVLLSAGAGHLGAAPIVAANGVLPNAAATGDFNGDGKLDIVTTGIGGNATILFNNGDGSFRTGPTLTVDGTPSSVVVGDFNGDGKQDIAVGTEAGIIDLFLGNGNGTFQAPKIINLGVNNSIQSLVTGDFNGDGHLDLAITSNLLTSSGDVGLVTVLTGSGTGSFHITATIKVGNDAEGLAVADFNGDHKLDLVTTSFLPDGTRDVKVLLGNGNGTFKTPLSILPGTIGREVAVGDFNGDGKQDVVLLDSFDNKVVVLPGNGNGTFGSPLTFTFNIPVKGLGGPAVGDFFGDGKLSLAVATGLGTVSILRGNGDGTFQAPVDYLVGFHGTEPATVIAGDFNNDGKPDLAATNFLGDDVSILLNTSPAPSHAAPVATTTALTADTATAVFGQQVTLTASVRATGAVPTGTVTFFDGNTILGLVALDPNGQASLTVPLSTGSHSLRATFAGIAPFSASASAALTETVARAATAITLNTDTQSIPGFVFLTATIAPVAPGAGLPTGTAVVRDGSTIVGTVQIDANGQAFFLLENLSPGKHTLTVSYSGDDDFLASISLPLVVTI